MLYFLYFVRVKCSFGLDDFLFFKLNVFGLNFYLKLKRNEYLIFLGFKVFCENSDGFMMLYLVLENIYYFGYVVFDLSFMVVVSNNGGLVRFFF